MRPARDTTRPAARHRTLPALLALALAPAAVLAGCGGGGQAGTAATEPQGRLDGAEASPVQAAPPLRLRDYRGREVDLSRLRGKAVLVTFIYTHCPDTCPLIVSHMRTVEALLGPKKARELRIVAVSTDPRGDTPKTVAGFLEAHGMAGRIDYLIGSRPQLERVWKAWGIVAKPAGAGRSLVEHSALVYGVSADGKLTTLYPANFGPAQVAHDVPLLARR